MALIKCKTCGNQMSKEADVCPSCGHPNKKNPSVIASIFTILIVGFGAYFYFGGGAEQQASSSMQDIENKVAADAVTQYNIAKNQGDKTQVCVQAMGVSAAYLQAKDDSNYNKWKDIEKSNCHTAGMPD